MAVLDYAPFFTVRTRPGLVVIDDFSTERPQLIVACIPWAAPGHVRATLNGNADSDATVAELVLRIAQSLHDEARDKYPGVPVVALMHWSLSGWSTPTGMATDEFKEPVIDTDRLEAIGFDAVCLGHIHRPGIVNWPESSLPQGAMLKQRMWNGTPPIVYAGSPLPLDQGERDCDHGVWILDIEPGRVTAEFRPLTHRKFLTIDLTQDWFEGWPDGMWCIEWPDFDGAIVRCRYQITAEQASRVTKRDVEQALLAAGAWHATAEPDVIRESRVRAEGVTESLDPLEALESWFAVQDPPLEPLLADGVREWTRKEIA